jgi:hypothetical protein
MLTSEKKSAPVYGNHIIINFYIKFDYSFKLEILAFIIDILIYIFFIFNIGFGTADRNK